MQTKKNLSICTLLTQYPFFQYEKTLELLSIKLCDKFPNFSFSLCYHQDIHCVKSVCIRNYSSPHFPVFGLDTFHPLIDLFEFKTYKPLSPKPNKKSAENICSNFLKTKV